MFYFLRSTLSFSDSTTILPLVIKNFNLFGFPNLSKIGFGTPYKKKYEDEHLGKPISNIWTDIGVANITERLGYPTQKPLALLERIIEGSTDIGDIILDPFCGCATACSAAERLDRYWIGIDVSSKAYDLIKSRLKSESGLDKFTRDAGHIIHRRKYWIV